MSNVKLSTDCWNVSTPPQKILSLDDNFEIEMSFIKKRKKKKKKHKTNKNNSISQYQILSVEKPKSSVEMFATPYQTLIPV